MSKLKKIAKRLRARSDEMRATAAAMPTIGEGYHALLLAEVLEEVADQISPRSKASKASQASEKSDTPEPSETSETRKKSKKPKSPRAASPATIPSAAISHNGASPHAASPDA
jgi:hypothetical protein